MSYAITTATKKINALTKRIRVIQGGTGASKTISILLLLIDAAQRDKKPTLTSIVSESFPHLKRGAIKDFISILQSQNYFDDARWNKTDYTYTFETGSKIEFFSVDQPGKVRGPRRERLFINEANNVSFDTYDQLEVRTTEVIYIDYNPCVEFWVFDKVKNRPDCDYLILTYQDNEALQAEIVQSIERRKSNASWWRVYGCGLLGEVEGRIYRDWQIIDSLPHEARLERRGLDFGYTNDPTAIVDVYRYDGGWILDEKEYRRGMTNREISDFLRSLEPVLTTADAAEPKSIDEIRSYGVTIVPAIKGPGSVNQGIQFVQDQRISVTKNSANLIREYRNYLWEVDRNGKTLNVPEQGNDHALDAVRYAFTGLWRDTFEPLTSRPKSELFSKEVPIEDEVPFHY